VTALSSEQREQLGDVLGAARADVVGHIRGRLEGSSDPAAVSLLAHLGQPDDMGQAAYIALDELAVLGQEQGLLRDIDAAIRRNDEGAANVCESCGEDIPFERLLAVPTARTCIACQEAAENAAHTHGGPTM
jgi:RNA polymerase-binding transcription factor DksA